MNLEEKVSIIINRNAGNGNEAFAAKAEKLCGPYPAHVHSTQTVDGMKKRVLTDLDNGLELIIICGGDGTLMVADNFVRDHCAETGRQKPGVGYFPFGTGNLLNSLIQFEQISDPLLLLLNFFLEHGADALPIQSFPQVKTTFTDAQSGEEHSLLYSMNGSGMNAALLQDFEVVCRGKFGPFASGVPGYVRSVVGRTIPRELYSLVRPIFDKEFAKAGVRITSQGPIKGVAETFGIEELYPAPPVLYDGPLSELHTVLAGSLPYAGFGVIAFPHLDMKSQMMPHTPMQVRVLSGPKLKVVGHLLYQTPNIVRSRFHSSPFFDEYLVGEGGSVTVEYDIPTALQIGGDFVAEASSINYKREGELEIVDWSKLAA